MEADTLESQLLLYAKTGSCPHIQRLLQSRIHQNTSLDINCRSRSKASSGWTSLHMACYFGHREVVEELLKAGADANLQNNMGDTPLHKAAYTGRKEIVLLLLRYDACSNIINGTAQIPKDVTEDDEIITMLEAAERRETRRREEKLLEAAREGDISTLSKMLSGKEAPDIHCRDSVGNTPLHCAAYRGQKQCIIKLLKSGASPSIKNSNDQTALDLIRSDELRLILAAYQVKRWLDAFEAHSSYSTRHCTEEKIIDDADGDGGTTVRNLSHALQAANAFQ
ncbi:Oxysterol-binding protein-related protein 1 [Collichthys lucidus]|uniref:Oxysterol-binding protein-related protein 1 n=1 Tax=Collichthys lucidus TaxID=240159 RepID=A0A4U5UYF4_COLLU|nr:Oxysterol-binding protein-related protein 1 [Collichthys lucidus]